MRSGRHLINELRRRNVFRAVVAYWVVAWTCIEVSSVVEQALSLPEWVDLAFVIFSMAGLPIVIVVSWVFEWSPLGLVIDDRDAGSWQLGDKRQELANQIAREVHARLINDLSPLRNEAADR